VFNVLNVPERSSNQREEFQSEVVGGREGSKLRSEQLLLLPVSRCTVTAAFECWIPS